MKGLKIKKILAAAGVCGLILSVSQATAGMGPGGGGKGPGGGGGMEGGTTTQPYDSGFTSIHFSGSGNCQLCHNNLTDQNSQDVSIETAWSSTMMANAARDPAWMAKVRSEITRNPQLEAVINDKCTRCHAPMANTEAHFLGDSPGIFENGFLNPANPHFDEAMDAVSCTLCHQIMETPDLGTLPGFSGHYQIETFANPVDRRIYGPYTDLLVQPMRNMVEYTVAYSAHTRESKICAACHNLKTPYVDENGDLLSTSPADEFPEQMPYSEWEHSSYPGQQSCQDCHMSRADGVVISTRPMWLDTRRDNFAIHDLAGGNKLMLGILADNRDALNVTSTNLGNAMNEADKMLQGSAAIELLQSSLVNGVLDFQLQLISKTGHKLPSGIPFRRAILHVTVTDSKGRVVFESGKVNHDGSVAGVASDVDPYTFEPHYDLITSGDQVQVYEAVMENNLGEVTYTLLRAMNYAKDNRLLPAGFDKYTAGNDIRVAGTAYDDSNFVGGSDLIRYRVAGLRQGRYTVKAELVYQTFSHAFIQDLLMDNAEEISAFEKMYAAAGQKSTVIASAMFSLR